MIDESKIVVIYQNEIGEETFDGMVEPAGSLTEDNLHSACLLELSEKRYPTKEIFKKLTYRHRPDTIGYFYTLYGSIVILNTTKHEEKYGKSIMIMMPDMVSEKQKNSLEKLLSEIPTYDMVIGYDLKMIDGFLETKELSSSKKASPLETLQIYYQKKGLDPKKGNVK